MIINWLQPYATDKNIGREYNRLISLMPDDSWIGITDHDALFLRPDSKAQIAGIVAEHGHEFEVFGVMTNRLFGSHQRHLGQFNEDPNISNHIAIANNLHDTYHGEIEETKFNIAGLCMVFNKATWVRAGGFNERSVCLDKEFTDDVMRAGGKLAVMTGVYVFHLYRWGKKNPFQDISHLF